MKVIRNVSADGMVKQYLLKRMGFNMKKINYLEIKELNPYDNDQLLDVILEINNKLDELIDAVNEQQKDKETLK